MPPRRTRKRNVADSPAKKLSSASSASVELERGEAYLEESKFREALECSAKAARLDRDDARVHLLASAASFELASYAECVQACEQTVSSRKQLNETRQAQALHRAVRASFYTGETEAMRAFAARARLLRDSSASSADSDAIREELNQMEAFLVDVDETKHAGVAKPSPLRHAETPLVRGCALPIPDTKALGDQTPISYLMPACMTLCTGRFEMGLWPLMKPSDDADDIQLWLAASSDFRDALFTLAHITFVEEFENNILPEVSQALGSVTHTPLQRSVHVLLSDMVPETVARSVLLTYVLLAQQRGLYVDDEEPFDDPYWILRGEDESERGVADVTFAAYLFLSSNLANVHHEMLQDVLDDLCDASSGSMEHWRSTLPEELGAMLHLRDEATLRACHDAFSFWRGEIDRVANTLMTPVERQRLFAGAYRKQPAAQAELVRQLREVVHASEEHVRVDAFPVAVLPASNDLNIPDLLQRMFPADFEVLSATRATPYPPTLPAKREWDESESGGDSSEEIEQIDYANPTLLMSQPSQVADVRQRPEVPRSSVRLSPSAPLAVQSIIPHIGPLCSSIYLTIPL